MLSTSRPLNLIRLEQVVDRSPLTASPKTTVLAAIAQMAEQSGSCLLVIAAGKLVGIFTSSDALKLMAAGMDLSQMQLAAAMTQPVISLTLSSDQTVSTAFFLMQQHQIHQLPILDDRAHLLGLLTQDALCQVLDPVSGANQLDRQRQADQLERQEHQPVNALKKADDSGQGISSLAVAISRHAHLEANNQSLAGELLQCEQQFASLVEHSPDIIFRLDLQLRHIYIGPRVIEVSGHGPEHFLGKTGRELGLPAAACEVFEAACQTAIATGEVTRVEYAIAERHYLSRLIPERSTDGAIATLLGVTEEISERKQLETALRTSEEKLRLSLDMNSIGIWEWDIETGAVFWNDSHYRVLGYQPGEIEPSYQHWRDRVHPEDVELSEQRIIQALETHRDYETEFRVILEDGSIHWLQSKGRGLYDEAGQPVRMVGVEFDISERKRQEADRKAAEIALYHAYQDQERYGRELEAANLELEEMLLELQAAEEELRQQNEELLDAQAKIAQERQQYQDLFQFAPDGYLVTDLQGVVREANQAAYTLLDPAGDYLVNSPLSQRVVESGHRSFCNHLYQLSRCDPNQIFSFELNLQPQQGEPFIAAISSTPIHSSAGELSGFRWLIRNITERKHQAANAAADLRDTQLLHNLSTRLTTETDIQVLYDEIVATAIALTQADAGTIQILDTATQELVLIAAQGFDSTMTTHFHRVNTTSNTTCGIALARGERFLIDFDVPERDDPDGSLRMHIEAGYLSAQSSPLISRSGKQIGMVSTHWHQHYRPCDRELRFLDILARQAADLIEQRQAEAALRESEQMLRLSLASAQSGTWDWDRATGKLTWSPETYHLHGLDPSDGLPEYEGWYNSVLHPDDRLWVNAHVTLVLEQRLPTIQIEFRILHPQLGVRWLLSRGRLTFNEQGEPVRLSGINLDISDRKQSEIQLREMSAALSNAVEGIAQIDPQGRYLFVNEAYAGMVGYTSAEMMGMNWQSTVHPDDLELVVTAYQQLCNTDKVELEARGLRKDGSGFVKQIVMVATYTDQQQFIGHYCFIKDITEKKRLEADRQRAELKIREQAALLDIASDAILVSDLDHRIQYWNQGSERLYGWTGSEAIGQSAPELLHTDAAQMAEMMQTLLSQGEWRGEIQKVTKSGKSVIVEARWTLVQQEANQPNLILCVDTDITEKKQLEAQFLRAQRLESIGTLAGGIAHDLNNMLTPILISSQLLQRQLSAGRQQELLKMMEANARRGADLVRQVLTFARGTEGKFIPLQPKHLLKEISQICDHTFPKAITITLDVPSDLALISADPTQLHQVLMNLCVNARDAMPEGGSLRLRAENFDVDEIYARMNLEAQPGPYVLITVADTGTGMTPEVLERIFDPFFTTKVVGQGTGLGLSVVQGIIRSHGGFITVKSKPGEGTQFQVYLRATLAIEAQTTSESELPLGHGELILVVDDEAPLRLIAKTVLEDHNYRVLTASNGIEAINLYLQHRDDVRVILMDMMMPEMGGETAIQTINQINPDIRVIASSGLPLHQFDPGCTAAVQASLAKPYTAQDLLTTLSQILQSGNTQPGNT